MVARSVSAAHPKPSVAGREWRKHQRINPDAAREMAQCTVVRLEKALEAMGDVKGPAVEVLKSELTKAKPASKQPLDVEIEQCRKYSARGERRIKELDSNAQRSVLCSQRPLAPREIGERTVSGPHHGSQGNRSRHSSKW